MDSKEITMKDCFGSDQWIATKDLLDLLEKKLGIRSASNKSLTLLVGNDGYGYINHFIERRRKREEM